MIKAKVNLLVQDDFEPIELMAVRRVEDLDFSSEKYICSQYCYLDLKNPPKEFVKPVLRRPSSFSREIRADSPPSDMEDIPDEDPKTLLRFVNITTKETFQWEVEPNLGGFELLAKLNEKYPGKNPILQLNEASGNEAMVIQPENLAMSTVKDFGLSSESILYVKTT